uniref:Integrase catalytic domain-containing protein n=1 Tax=Syphacia muris TaxID=451379 RepID=A0A0N5AAI2_9BILA
MSKVALSKVRIASNGSLPESKIKANATFKNTAVDYAGPFHAKVHNDDTVKIWICLFTCIATKALHLETVKDLTAAEFLLPFQRFAARRGTPKTIFSENGTRFVAATTLINIKWKFITPHTPWQGRICERRHTKIRLK